MYITKDTLCQYLEMFSLFITFSTAIFIVSITVCNDAYHVGREEQWRLYVIDNYIVDVEINLDFYQKNFSESLFLIAKHDVSQLRLRIVSVQ